MAHSYHAQSLPPTVYHSLPSTHTPLDPQQQNDILTQAWLWLPPMRCSLYSDNYSRTIYTIVEITWNGYSKIFHLQPEFGPRGEGMRDATEMDLKPPGDEDVGFGQLVLRGGSEGRIGGALRSEGVGPMGRALGIGLTSEGMRYQGVSGGGDGAYHQQLAKGHQYGGSGYQARHGSSYGHGQVRGFDSSSSEEDRSFGRGDQRESWSDRNNRDERSDRGDRGNRGDRGGRGDRGDRGDRDGRRGSHGKDGGGKKSDGREKERDGKDRKVDKREKSSPERKERN